MRSIYWKSKSLSYLAIFTLIVYLLFRLKTYSHQASVTLTKVKPGDVWEYVADFSNIKDLNPTINNFNIIDESGNYDHWKYSVEYSEHLSQWPYLENHAIGHFNINANHASNIYFMNSTHVTCIFGDYFCVSSNSVFKISNTNEGVLCQESVEYQCPVVLSQFCFREVDFQRKAIMRNLKLHFQRKS